MYITGASPIRVTAMPVWKEYERDSVGNFCVSDRSAIITCLNDDDSVFRVTGCSGFGFTENSYRICGEHGQMENVRGTDGKVMLCYNKWSIPEGRERKNFYMPELKDKDKALIEKSGHGGGDFLVMREFLDCIRENRRPLFDVYFATTMASVAILSHRSLLERGVPYDIPDLKREEDRKKYENDNLTPFPSSDGSAPTIESSSHKKRELSQEELDRLLQKLNAFRSDK